MAKKGAWFKFYPTDWRADPELRLCSLAARGLWFEMLGYMYEAKPQGYLLINGVAIPRARLPALIGIKQWQTVYAALDELEANGVFSRDEQGRIYSRRILRDIEMYEKMVKSGKLGGNPALLKKVNPADNQELKVHARAVQSPESREVQKQEQGQLQEQGNPAAPAGPAPPRSKPTSGNERATRLPDDWELPVEWAAWAQAERPDWSAADVLRVGLKFRDHWLGNRKAHVWLPTWRNWVRSELTPRARSHASGKLTQAGQRTAEAAERWLGKSGTNDDEEGER